MEVVRGAYAVVGAEIPLPVKARELDATLARWVTVPAAAPAEEPVLDMEVVEELRGLAPDGSLLVQVVDTFVESAAEHVAELGAAAPERARRMATTASEKATPAPKTMPDARSCPRNPGRASPRLGRSTRVVQGNRPVRRRGLLMRASESLLDLAFVALDHAVDTVRHGDQLAPFALVEAEGRRNIARFVTGTLEASIDEARGYLRGRTDAIRAALAYDGFITLDGTRYDAVFVEAHEAGQDSAIVICQRYQPKRRRRPFQTIGNPGDAGDAAPLLAQNTRTARESTPNQAAHAPR